MVYGYILRVIFLVTYGRSLCFGEVLNNVLGNVTNAQVSGISINDGTIRFNYCCFCIVRGVFWSFDVVAFYASYIIIT